LLSETPFRLSKGFFNSLIEDPGWFHADSSRFHKEKAFREQMLLPGFGFVPFRPCVCR